MPNYSRSSLVKAVLLFSASARLALCSSLPLRGLPGSCLQTKPHAFPCAAPTYALPFPAQAARSAGALISRCAAVLAVVHDEAELPCTPSAPLTHRASALHLGSERERKRGTTVQQVLAKALTCLRSAAPSARGRRSHRLLLVLLPSFAFLPCRGPLYRHGQCVRSAEGVIFRQSELIQDGLAFLADLQNAR